MAEPATRGAVQSAEVLRYAGGVPSAAQDELATEEPIEIRVDGEPWTVVMRTPGEDLELAVGLLRSEQMIEGPGELASVLRCGDGPDEMIDVLRTDSARSRRTPRRSLLASTSCGVCGKRAIEDLGRQLPAHDARIDLDPSALAALPERLRAAQAVFARTGGLHAAGIFSVGGEPLVIREDVGRHNAVDKCVGHLLLRDTPPEARILVVSGRVSFEIVQKAWAYGLRAIVAVSAPSSLAVELSRSARIALYGFARGSSINEYA
ncbi:MAG: formate dehydrogenase accessory sulfurtransferase FdhD [Myxococcota bacterium]